MIKKTEGITTEIKSWRQAGWDEIHKEIFFFSLFSNYLGRRVMGSTKLRKEF